MSNTFHFSGEVQTKDGKKHKFGFTSTFDVTPFWMLEKIAELIDVDVNNIIDVIDEVKVT